MKELFDMIEAKIKEAGYPDQISGEEFYYDISAEADEKENGTYMFIINKNDKLFYKGCMTIMDEQFDLHFVDIQAEENSYHIDFDA